MAAELDARIRRDRADGRPHHRSSSADSVKKPEAGHFFVGRRRELAESARLCRTSCSPCRARGAGRPGWPTRPQSAVDSYPYGVHVVTASLSRAELVPQTVASVLDVPLPETGTAEVALARQLAERRLLIVLDNCEHLLDACARVADALLRVCPDVVVLATSREPLRVGGEVTWRTPSLALPDLQHLPPLARLAELESIRLFVERARDAAPGFVLDATTAPAVAEICVRLDGMPLALELAAARTSALAPGQIASRLDDALRVLGRGSRSAVTRQQTLHATLAWSHDLLSEDERVLFRRLAVFAGSMSLEAVEHVCGGDGLERRRPAESPFRALLGQPTTPRDPHLSPPSTSASSPTTRVRLRAGARAAHPRLYGRSPRDRPGAAVAASRHPQRGLRARQPTVCTGDRLADYRHRRCNSRPASGASGFARLSPRDRCLEATLRRRQSGRRCAPDPCSPPPR